MRLIILYLLQSSNPSNVAEREHSLDYLYISMAMEEMKPSTNFTQESSSSEGEGMTVSAATLLLQ